MKKFRPITDIALIVVSLVPTPRAPPGERVGSGNETKLFCITPDTHCYMRHLPVAAMADMSTAIDG